MLGNVDPSLGRDFPAPALEKASEMFICGCNASQTNKGCLGDMAACSW